MGKIRELAERLFSGAVSTEEHHPFTPMMAIEEVAPRTAFASSFANVTALDTDAGLVLVDTGSFVFAKMVKEHVRSFTTKPLHTAIFTHGHVDHVFGVEAYEAEPRPHGAPAPRVVAHEALAARFDRYKETRGYNACINARQFQVSASWPDATYRYPDVTYRDRLDLDVGGERIELHHARGETDDHTWVWVPSRKLLCTGDLFIWATPNAGNPQKVQRYPREWARALRAMAALGAETMCPGHGPPIFGAANVKRALSETAELLESLWTQTVALMNEGKRLDAILREVKAEPSLLERPYLRPIYDEPEFIVRNVYRLLGGWYDGNPAHLKPGPDAALAAEVARLAGGAGKLASRAAELAGAGELAVACHLAEMAALGDPGDAEIRAVRASVYEARAASETSLMARGIFGSAARETPK
jgi:alkyl sulfatase BDS1-like metallo-beta-lactamase superfamily hydrolase